MAEPKMPTDVAGERIQALNPSTNVETLAHSGTKTKSTITADSTVVRLTAFTTEVLFAFGSAGEASGLASSAGNFLPINSPEYFRIESGQHIGVKAADGATSGTLYISVMQ